MLLCPQLRRTTPAPSTLATTNIGGSSCSHPICVQSSEEEEEENEGREGGGGSESETEERWAPEREPFSSENLEKERRGPKGHKRSEMEESKEGNEREEKGCEREEEEGSEREDLESQRESEGEETNEGSGREEEGCDREESDRDSESERGEGENEREEEENEREEGENEREDAPSPRISTKARHSRASITKYDKAKTRSRLALSRRVSEYKGVFEISKSNKTKLFCVSCRKQVSADSSTAKRHVDGKRHKLELEVRERRIADGKAIEKDVAEYYQKNTVSGGASVEKGTTLFRVSVLTMMLRAGIPLEKLSILRPFLEEISSKRLTDVSNMRKLVPIVYTHELAKLRDEIKGNQISCIFDGTTRDGMAEVLAVVVRYGRLRLHAYDVCLCCNVRISVCIYYIVCILPSRTRSNWLNVFFHSLTLRFVTETGDIVQRLVHLKHYEKSFHNRELAGALNDVLAQELGVASKNIVGWMMDRAASNLAAATTLLILHSSSAALVCLSHTIMHCGEHIFGELGLSFLNTVSHLFSKSLAAKTIWKLFVIRFLLSKSKVKPYVRVRVCACVRVYIFLYRCVYLCSFIYRDSCTRYHRDSFSFFFNIFNIYI
jgi:hypothetical protein